VLGFNSQQRFMVYKDSVDMRKGVYGLCGFVINELKENPSSGTVYVFFSKSYTTVKILVWDKDGFVVYGKWLTKGRFENVKSVIKGKAGELSYQYLVMLLSGVSLLGVKQRPRYKLLNSTSSIDLLDEK
jgi:transposase